MLYSLNVLFFKEHLNKICFLWLYVTGLQGNVMFKNFSKTYRYKIRDNILKNILFFIYENLTNSIALGCNNTGFS